MKLLECGTLPSGSTYWETRCGSYRLVKSECCYGVELPTEWKVWQWHHGMWRLLRETRSRKAAESFIKSKLAEEENED